MFVVFVEFGVMLCGVVCVVVFMWGVVICFSASVIYLCCVVFSVNVVCVVFCVFVLMFSVYVYCCVLWRVESLCLERGLQTRLQTLHSLQHCSTQHRVIITSAADLITNICTTV